MSNEIVAGRYTLVRELGRGASATVFLAHDSVLDRDVALKIVAPALANDPGFVDRFMREARLAAGLNHPNIVTVFDVGETSDQRPFIAMSLVQGTGLETAIEQSAPLPVREAARILTELASALDYLHSQGLVHRDVKPSNILVEETGRVMLSDFGVAYARESARYTMTGVALGTPRYMAPEQMQGEEPTPQTDVYAMGVLAFEMLAGAPPFEGSGTGLMYKIVHEPPPLLSAKAPNVPAGIEAAIARALEKEPAARWASPGEFAAAIAGPEAEATFSGPAAVFAAPAAFTEAATADEQPAAPPAPEPDAATGGAGRRRALFGLGAAAVLGLAASGYCLAAGGGDPNASDDDDEPTATSVATSAGASPSPTLSASTATLPPAATATPTPSPSPTPTPTSPPTASPTPAPPDAPSNVTLNGSTLSWSDNSNNEQGFRVYWRATNINGGAVTQESDKSVGPNVTTTSVASIILPAIYTDFRRGVSAYNAAGESAIAWTQ